MRKLMVLAFKEIKLTFKDLGGLLLMIATPFALTLAVAAAFGGDGDVAIAELPVLIANEDNGAMGGLLVEVLQPAATDNLIAPQLVTDVAAARAAVDADTAVALVTIPHNFSEVISAGEPEIAPTIIDIYASPARPIGTLIVRAIVDQFLQQLNLRSSATQILLQDLGDRGLIETNQAAYEAASQAYQTRLLEPNATGQISVDTTSTTSQAFNWLNYFAPSLAMLFLLFAATGGGRTFLAEKEQGTLSRLLISPTPQLVILLGKMTGTAVTGLIQVAVLWIATALVGAYWGPAGLVAAGVLLLVLSTTGLGAIIATWTRNTAQANIISAGVVLTASVLSGNFYPRMNLPDWVQTVSLVTPNGWGLELFVQLQSGATFSDVLPLLGGLMVLTIIYYAIAAAGFRRQFI